MLAQINSRTSTQPYQPRHLGELAATKSSDDPGGGGNNAAADIWNPPTTLLLPDSAQYDNTYEVRFGLVLEFYNILTVSLFVSMF